MSQRGSFALIVELDQNTVREVNHRLMMLGKEGGSRAMRNGFRRWTTHARKFIAKSMPMGRTSATEMVRGEVKANVHLKFNVTTRIKGYSKGLLVWAGIGIKEIRGSYLTPHWYMRWVEHGHDMKRRATDIEKGLMDSRGHKVGKNTTVTVARARGAKVFTRALPIVTPMVVPMLTEAVNKEIERG